MMFEVLFGGRVVGTTHFEGWDLGMGVANGRFVPTAEYEAIRSVFRMFADAEDETDRDEQRQQLQAYYTARAALDLSLRAKDGTVIPTSSIHIADYSHTLGDDAYEIEVRFSTPNACNLFAAKAKAT